MPKLSVMVPTIVTRQPLFERLMTSLYKQLPKDYVTTEDGDFARLDFGDVEIVVYRDNGDISIGEKRNKLVAYARGDYLMFVDDDDLLSDDALALILQAIENGPDTIGFKLVRFVNDVRMDVAIHSLRYDKWGEKREGGKIVHYERTPNHLNPTRAGLVRQVEYKDKSWGEDSDYSLRLRPLLRSECFIDRELYIYLYREQQDRRGEVTHRGHVGPIHPRPASKKYVRPPRGPLRTGNQ